MNSLLLAIVLVVLAVLFAVLAWFALVLILCGLEWLYWKANEDGSVCFIGTRSRK